MKIYIGADHGGYQLKEELKKYLSGLGYELEDMGAHSLDPQDDYPDFVIPTSEKVSNNSESLGIVIGRSGTGEIMAANKVKRVRAAVCVDEESAKLAREKNNANVLSIGADFTDFASAQKIVKVFLETPFSQEERHIRRLQKITAYETGQNN